MTTFSHTLEMELSIGDALMRFKADVDYTCTPGTPASGPSFSDPGDPGDPPELEVEKVTLVVDDIMAFTPRDQPRPTKEVEAPEWLLDFIANNDTVYRELGEACDWGEDVGDPDYELDLRREDDRT
jgi:hypothetical protein